MSISSITILDSSSTPLTPVNGTPKRQFNKPVSLPEEPSAAQVEQQKLATPEPEIVPATPDASPKSAESSHSLKRPRSDSESSVEEDILPSPLRSQKPVSVIAPPPEKPENVGPTSRLVIHKLVLVDFKSYAGRQEIGPFHKVYLTLILNVND